MLNSSHKKELWCFAYQYAVWISRRTENRLRGDVTYFLWHGIRPSYKHINQDKKVAFIRVDEDGALPRSSEFMRTCHKMNIIVQTTGGDASSLNGKS